MSRSKCPFPNKFECRRFYRRPDGTQNVLDLVAVKDNGWYRLYYKADMESSSRPRRTYGGSLRWYNLERLVQIGYIFIDEPESFDMDTIDLEAIL